MYKIYLLVFLLLLACDDTSRDINSMSLRDNENMVYDNYIDHSKYKDPEPIPQDTLPSQLSNPFIAQSNDASCVYGCTTPPLRIAVMPMSFKSEIVAHEILNTVDFLNSNINQNKYHVSIIESGQDFIKDFMIVQPDVIIGPFTEDDIKSLHTSLKQNNINIPVITLATKSSISSNNIRYFGYSVDDTVSSIVDTIKKNDIQNYGLLVPNTATGSATYNLLKKRIDDTGKKLSRVEFYEEGSPSNMQKYVNKIKMAVNQVYYVAQDGKVIEDDHSFAKKIKEENDTSVTLKDGTMYQKKHTKMGALIIDADPKYFEALFDMMVQDPIFEDVLLLGTARIIDAIIPMTHTGKYESCSKPLLFPANFSVYRNFYVSYGREFSTPPSKISITLYETAVYLITLHDKSDITKGLKLQDLPVFIGLNGTMVARGERSVMRYTNTSEFKNGNVMETANVRLENNM